MAKLTGKQIQQLSDAMLGAFDQDGLRRLLLFHLDRDLARISSSTGNVSGMALDVIQAAEREGWTASLLRAIAAERPNRQDIQSLVAELLQTVERGEKTAPPPAGGALQPPRVAPPPPAAEKPAAPPAPTGSATGYYDFDIEIGQGAGLEYPVAVLGSPAGEARATMRFPYDALRLESALDKLQIALLRSGGKRRTALSPEQQAVREFGQALFDALLTGEARSRYDVSLERAGQADKGLRVRLRFRAPDLAALPWEFLYDARGGDYLCLSTNTPLVRYLELPRPPQPLAVAPPLRILGLVAAPTDLPTLDVENEKARVERALAGLVKKGVVELVWLAEPTWRGLQQAMRREKWHIFHFIGHGAFDAAADEGLVYLEDEERKGAPFTATQLGRLLADHPPLRLAVLNACEGARGGKRDIFSSTASILVGRGLPAVLAMQYEITDRAAIELARTFYEAVADGLPVDAAVAEARKAVSFAVANTVEWGTPVLYMRSPDGVLFNVAAVQPAAVEKPVRVEEPPPIAGTTRATPAPEEAAPKAPAEVVVKPARKKSPSATDATRAAPAAEIAPKEPVKAVEQPAREKPSPAEAAPKAPAEVVVKPAIPPTPAAQPDTLNINAPIRMELVRVPAGPFLMGSDKTKDPGAYDDELPQHTVDVAEFYIGKYPVTNAQYASFVATTKHEPPAHWKGFLRSARIPSGEENHPVVNVTWRDAVAFTEWLSQQTGKAFRLPTEAEWEKAARGADGRLWPWGNEWDPKRANTSESGLRDTTPVGAYSLQGDSPLGAADMAGNVWEWCSTKWRGDYTTAADDSLTGDDARVVRGGSWNSCQWFARCAFRLRFLRVNFNDNLGFRVVLSLSS